MTIPKSYEALSADLASEKILSKTLTGQKESYMMLADHLKLDLATWKQKACETAEREAALREEIEMAKQVQETTDAIVTMMDGQRDHWIEKCGLLKQRLTVAGQRVGELAGLLRDADSAHGNMLMSDPPQEAWKYHRISERISAALKPADMPHRLSFYCLACNDYHEGSGNLPCLKMTPMSGVKP